MGAASFSFRSSDLEPAKVPRNVVAPDEADRLAESDLEQRGSELDRLRAVVLEHHQEDSLRVDLYEASTRRREGDVDLEVEHING